MSHSNDLRKRFIEHMTARGYNLVSRDSLVSPTFPTCFTVSGGPSFIDRYLKQPTGREDVVVMQPCHRFWDVDQVGDKTHLSFFEMAVTYSCDGLSREDMFHAHFDFLTKELGLDPRYFTASVFGGGECYGTSFKQDGEAISIWKSLGITQFNIHQGFGYNSHDDRLVNESFVANTVEPIGGPRTELFYGGLEVWTSVHYNTYVKCSGEGNEFTFEPIESDSTIAAGFGLERVIQATRKLETVGQVHPLASAPNERAADFARGLVFLAQDGAFDLTGNQNSGRRTVLNKYVRSFIEALGTYDHALVKRLAEETVLHYGKDYPELKDREDDLARTIGERVRRLKLA